MIQALKQVTDENGRQVFTVRYKKDDILNIVVSACIEPSDHLVVSCFECARSMKSLGFELTRDGHGSAYHTPFGILASSFPLCGEIKGDKDWSRQKRAIKTVEIKDLVINYFQ